METLNLLESAVLKKMLSGNSETLRTLYKQYLLARVKERSHTGAGFFTNFSLPDDAPKLAHEESFEICDVSADLADLENGAGFVLFIRSGAIHVLEGYSFDEPWPEHINLLKLYYNGLSERKERE